VGHSLGGLIVYHFAQHYPTDVGGLVLLDAPHPRQMQEFADALNSYAREGNPIPANLQHLRDATADTDPALHPEQLDFGASLASIRAADSLPDIPLAVLSRGTSFHEDMPDLPAPLAQLFDTVWHNLQRDLARHTPRGTHIVVPNGGHYLQADAPKRVIDAISRIITIVREH
jgi:pimeloyl-ACP methyl ester carboxylesterase